MQCTQRRTGGAAPVGGTRLLERKPGIEEGPSLNPLIDLRDTVETTAHGRLGAECAVADALGQSCGAEGMQFTPGR